MFDPELLKVLCCPETHQGLCLAEAELLEKLNQKVAAGLVKNRAGQRVSGKIAQALLREDRKILYPIRNNIPVMLVDEGIVLEDQAGQHPVKHV